MQIIQSKLKREAEINYMIAIFVDVYLSENAFYQIIYTFFDKKLSSEMSTQFLAFPVLSFLAVSVNRSFVQFF